uniref:Uncharacterized protein n=1 Tax=Glossina palpalis gambiensis TaxID=67801 RepID=A0A1B0BW07_9MUSC
MKYLCLLICISVTCTAPVNENNPGAVDGLVELVDNVALKRDKLPTKEPKIVTILESDAQHKLDGSYSFHYRGADGSFREEIAVVKNPGTKQAYLEVSGAYSFIDADGEEITVNYKADNRGFVPVGSNIPETISVSAKENSERPAPPTENFDEINDDEV